MDVMFVTPVSSICSHWPALHFVVHPPLLLSRALSAPLSSQALLALRRNSGIEPIPSTELDSAEKRYTKVQCVDVSTQAFYRTPPPVLATYLVLRWAYKPRLECGKLIADVSSGSPSSERKRGLWTGDHVVGTGLEGNDEN